MANLPPFACAHEMRNELADPDTERDAGVTVEGVYYDHIREIITLEPSI